MPSTQHCLIPYPINSPAIARYFILEAHIHPTIIWKVIMCQALCQTQTYLANSKKKIIPTIMKLQSLQGCPSLPSKHFIIFIDAFIDQKEFYCFKIIFVIWYFQLTTLSLPPPLTWHYMIILRRRGREIEKRHGQILVWSTSQ
jgi:hypothetical protein